MLGAFPVKRGTGGSDALEDAYALLKQNAVVGVFIEGHRSKDGLLRKPKTGAALLAYETKAPVVPVCITAGTASSPACSSAPSSVLASPSPPRLNIQDDSSLQLRGPAGPLWPRLPSCGRRPARSWAALSAGAARGKGGPHAG